MRTVAGASLSILLLTIVASACTSGNSDAVRIAELEEGCLLNSDCAAHLVCAFRSCHVECNVTADCRAQNLGLCVESDKPYRVCQNPKEESCLRNSDCPGTEVCAADEKCRDACRTSKDCVGGQECTAGVCADATDLTDGGLPRADAGAEGRECLHASDCPGTLVCLHGACAAQCINAKDCNALSTCDQTRCVPLGYDGGIPTSGEGQ